MLLSGKMLLVGLHCSPEEGMVRAWHIEQGSDLVLPGRHRVSISTLSAWANTMSCLPAPYESCACQLHGSIRQQAISMQQRSFRNWYHVTSEHFIQAS